MKTSSIIQGSTVGYTQGKGFQDHVQMNWPKNFTLDSDQQLIFVMVADIQNHYKVMYRKIMEGNFVVDEYPEIIDLFPKTG